MAGGSGRAARRRWSRSPVRPPDPAFRPEAGALEEGLRFLFDFGDCLPAFLPGSPGEFDPFRRQGLSGRRRCFLEQYRGHILGFPDDPVGLPFGPVDIPDLLDVRLRSHREPRRPGAGYPLPFRHMRAKKRNQGIRAVEPDRMRCGMTRYIDSNL